MSTRAEASWLRAGFALFLGRSPPWYKLALIAALLVNPIVLQLAGPFVAGWLILLEFIAALALALKCYPLQPAGLLVIEAIVMRLADTGEVAHEVEANFAVILLLMFMVAGIHFLRELLLVVFSALLVRIRSQQGLALCFCATSALLSAFLDALTVVAVVATVTGGFYALYHRVASARGTGDEHDHGDDSHVAESHREDLDQFRAFLRGLVMHAAVGTALGGVLTLVGEPQNLLIAQALGWDFKTFALHMAPVTLPVLGAGLLLCVLLERWRFFGYGRVVPSTVRDVIFAHAERERAQRDRTGRLRIAAQALAAVFLVVGLLFHLAEIGLIGLGVIVLATALTGVVDEHRLGEAFKEALPFTALLVVFFAVVAVIHRQELFAPVIQLVLAGHGEQQLLAAYAANGALSAISDNVFVATVYMSQLQAAHASGQIGRDQLELLAVAVNTGTNIPSVATPNGQAAFLFLLTSSLAPVIRLGYGRMVWMALPYTVVLTLTGALAVSLLH